MKTSRSWGLGSRIHETGAFLQFGQGASVLLKGRISKRPLYSKSTRFIDRFLTEPSLFLQSKRLYSINSLIHAIPRILNMRLLSICSVAAVLVVVVSWFVRSWQGIVRNRSSETEASQPQ